MNRKTLLATAMAALILAGCASSGVKISEQQLGQMKVGETTWADMVAALGQPTSSTFSSNGTHTAIYTYNQVTTRPETFIPYVGAFVGGADSKSSNVSLTFDKDGKLQSYQGDASAIGTAMGAASGTTAARTEAQPRQ